MATDTPLDLIYQHLANKLRHKAVQLKGNAIVGINYVVTPLPPTPSDHQVPTENKYKVSCTGNVVWVSTDGPTPLPKPGTLGKHA